tara:strand:- start:599 stop:1273 length:675 start_codon:yes stop_codon:yes gene_type:complete
MSKYQEETQLELYSFEERRMELKKMLKELIPHISGDWFIGKGALLGIYREGDLILEDHDIDIYLLPGTVIELPQGWGMQNYYMDTKLFKKSNELAKPNTWTEYCSLTKTKYPYLNRAQVFKEAKKTYASNKIEPLFTKPFFDIYNLTKEDDRYVIPYWTEYYGSFFYNNEVEPLVKNYVLGYEVNIPNNAENVLSRHFGSDWIFPNKKYKKNIKKFWESKNLSI